MKLRLPARIVLAGLAAAAPVLAGLLLPLTTGPTLCVFRILTGSDCPGCGLTRSVVALLHGDVRASLAAHPLGAVLFLGALWLWISILLGWARHGRFVWPRIARIPTWALVAGVGVFLGVYALRLAGYLGGTVDPPGRGMLGVLLP